MSQSCDWYSWSICCLQQRTLVSGSMSIFTKSMGWSPAYIVGSKLMRKNSDLGNCEGNKRQQQTMSRGYAVGVICVGASPDPTALPRRGYPSGWYQSDRPYR